nr:serine hydrolase domain-containing protein [Paracoccus marcusii]
MWARHSDDAIFRIYSMTKPLTSVAALILMEEGRLQLADQVHKFLPEFEGLEVSAGEDAGQGPEPTDRPMTVQDLLRHTSGLAYGELTQNEAVKAAYAEAGAFNPDGMAFDARGVSGDEQVSGLSRAPLARQPGTQWEYSLSTDVLGRVVEKVSGQRLGDFLEERVFGPLQMEDSGFHVPENAVTRLAEPFTTDPGSQEPLPMIDVSQPPANDSGGAGAVSSAGDYLRFAQMLASDGELDSVRILSPTTVRLMASDHLGEIDPGAGPGQLLMGSPGYTFGLGVMVRENDGIASVPARKASSCGRATAGPISGSTRIRSRGRVHVPTRGP